MLPGLCCRRRCGGGLFPPTVSARGLVEYPGTRPRTSTSDYYSLDIDAVGPGTGSTRAQACCTALLRLGRSSLKGSSASSNWDAARGVCVTDAVRCHWEPEGSCRCVAGATQMPFVCAGLEGGT
eukprot:2527282-Rhodomonas_salina.1